MESEFLAHIPSIEKHCERNEVLLNAGAVADKLFYVKSGILRLCYYQDGKDITFQFFFEGNLVCSLESFMKGTPSEYSIETIGQCDILIFSRHDLLSYAGEHPDIKLSVSEFMMERMINYTHLFLSRIKDTPEQRYTDLIKSNPEIIQRVPQHYIASYLGITPVSLSRIRSRK